MCVCDTLLHEPRYTPCHVYEAIKYLNLNLDSFCSPLDCFTLILARHLADVSCFIISEAIRDVEQTTGPSAKLKVVCFTSLSARYRASRSVKQSKLKALPSTTQDRAQDVQ